METITKFVQRKWFYNLAVFLVKSFLKLFYGLEVSGTEHIPKSGGIIVASNHISSFDPPVMGVSVPREINYMAKKELYKNRYVRALILGLRTFPVDRSKSDMNAIKEALRRLRAGVAIGIFAQGTRNKGDAEAFNGASYLAQRAGAPLVPAAIWREGRSFHVRFGEPIIPEGKSREEMQAMTAELMQRVRALMPAWQEKAPDNKENV